MRTWRQFPVVCLIWAGMAWAEPVTRPPPQEEAILDHLNDAIRWQRRLQALDRSPGEPSDVFYLDNARSDAAEALRLAFQVAEAESGLLAAQAPPPEPSEPPSEEANPDAGSAPHFDPAKAAARAAQRLRDAQTQLTEANEALARAPANARAAARARRDEMQAEVDLARAQQEAMMKMVGFSSSNEDKPSFESRLARLRASVPDVLGTTRETKTAAPPPHAHPTEPEGLVGEASLVLAQLRSLRELDQLVKDGQALHEQATQQRAPLTHQVKATLQEAREVADAQLDPNDQQALSMARDNLQRLTQQFKQLSAASVPFQEELILIEQAKTNLAQWRDSIRKQYHGALRALATHVISLVVALGLLLLFSEIWRRATFRYVSDVRRRRQFLILRRFVIGFLMVIVVVVGFVSEFGSLATFAGFLTAGIAVALQTVILSIAAYFFLIGRYGLRVGDRITVGGVTGDVVDVGLVRLYLMELAGTGTDLYSTGRVVVFSNSVLFSAGPLFKQIPGTEFTWHEVAIPLTGKENAAAAEPKLLEVVNGVYAHYRQVIERQHNTVARVIELQVAVPEPIARLQFAEAGLQCLIRFPVDLRRASEIDDQVTRALIEAIDRSPELKAAVAGSPRIRSAIKS
jgi:small-conductance mechanosensitive channel